MKILRNSGNYCMNLKYLSSNICDCSNCGLFVLPFFCTEKCRRQLVYCTINLQYMLSIHQCCVMPVFNRHKDHVLISLTLLRLLCLCGKECELFPYLQPFYHNWIINQNTTYERQYSRCCILYFVRIERIAV